MRMNRILQALSMPITIHMKLMALATVIGLSCFLAAYRTFFWVKSDWFDIQGYLFGRDFINVWFGAREALTGKISSIFIPSMYLQDMHGLMGKTYPVHNFSYPPHTLPLILVFGLLPYFPAFALWIVTGLASLFAALRANPYAKLSSAGLAVAALSPATLFTSMFGQNGVFTGALFLAGLFVCESSPVLAGVMFGLLTFKPHLGFLIPLALIITKNWKCFASAAVTGFIMVAASILLWGAGPWIDYIAITLPYQAEFINHKGHAYNPMMPGIWSDAICFMTTRPAAIFCFLASVPIILLTLMGIKKEGITPRTILMMALATMIVLPYGYNYDMVAVSGALAVYLATQPRIGLAPFLCFALLWVLPMTIFELKALHFVVSTILVASFFYLCLPQREAVAAAEQPVPA